PLLYDLDLNEGGGHIRGYQLAGTAADEVMNALNALAASMDAEIVMGDGNHSLAAAKSLWNEVRENLTPEERENHPLRFALVEINNVYDSAIEFFAIHRALMGIDSDKFIAVLTEKLEDKNGEWTVLWQTPTADGTIAVSAASIGELIGKVQQVIDDYLAVNGGEVDYIHGDEETRALGRRDGCASVLLPDMDKSDFFKTSLTGVFPRKSFSIGHARDKRYYLESRKIR
ncbi:MAG: DUF1015 family protein, partial [Oscillospiraceae bacterium]|nr:DUF1015 family protein [Oscillospiraceae bacterium]